MIITEQFIKLKTLEAKLELQQLINDFMCQPDVISGRAFDMGPTNKPRGWYEAISTTGYCVKVSEVFIERMLKNKHGYQRAQTLSITIDTNRFGKCGDGSHNAWHTCVDTGTGFVVDLTIAQFGSQYNNRFVWWIDDWLKEFRNPFDTH